MKTFKIISLLTVAVLVFGSSVFVYGASKKSKEITYYLMSFSEKLDSKSFGCGEYLVPIKKQVAKVNLKTVLKEFFKAHSKAVTPFEGSTEPDKALYGFDYFAVEKVNEPKKPSQKNPIKVYLRKSWKREIGGVCDGPRATEPLRETIATYAASIGNPPVQIFLDGSEKNWRCFDDASGLCQ